MQLNPGLHGWVKAPHSSTSGIADTTGGRKIRFKKGRRRGKPQRHKDKGPETRVQLFSHTVQLWYQSNHTSHSCIPLDNFVVVLCVCMCVPEIFSIFSFLRAFLSRSFYSGVFCLDMPQFLPLGANSTASVCTGGGHRIGFYPPFAAPNSNFSDLMSVWHLTPLSLQTCWFTCMTNNRASSRTMIHLWGNFCWCICPDSLICLETR